MPFAKETEIHRIFLGGLQHPMYVPVARRARGGIGARGRPGAPADHRRDATGDRMLDLLRTDEVNMGVQSSGGDDAAFAGDDFRRGADDHVDAILDERISRVPDSDDAAVLDADVSFDHALNSVENQRVGNDQVQGFRIGGKRRLAHPVANHLAAAEFHLATVSAIFSDQVALDFDE